MVCVLFIALFCVFAARGVAAPSGSFTVVSASPSPGSILQVKDSYGGRGDQWYISLHLSYSIQGASGGEFCVDLAPEDQSKGCSGGPGWTFSGTSGTLSNAEWMGAEFLISSHIGEDVILTIYLEVDGVWVDVETVTYHTGVDPCSPDLEPPVLTLISSDIECLPNGLGRACFSWSATDNCWSPTNDNILYNYDMDSIPSSGGGTTIEKCYDLLEGEHTFYVRATDAANNTTLKSHTFIVSGCQTPYTLTVTVSGNGHTNWDGESEWYAGSSVMLRATPADDWAFQKWGGDAQGALPEASITMDGHKNVTAYFIPAVVPQLCVEPYVIEFYLNRTTTTKTFEVWNCGTGSLSYTISETSPWLEISPESGRSEGEADTIEVKIDKNVLGGDSDSTTAKVVPSVGAEQEVTIIVHGDHYVPTPGQATGPTVGTVRQWLTYKADGVTCNYGHSVEYEFDWGDASGLPWGLSMERSHQFVKEGTYSVRVRARCVQNTSIKSEWSSPLKLIFYSLIAC